VQLKPRGAAAGVLGGVAAMAAWAASGVMAKGIDMPGMAIIVYRMWLYSVVVVVWLALRHSRLDRALLRRAAPGGLALGLDLALFFNAVKTTTIANATVIGALQPILMMALAYRLFGERVRRRDLVLSLVAMAGVTVVVFGSAGLPDASPVGDLLAAGALFAWTGYFAFSKRTQATMTPLQYTAATALWATALNTPIAIVSGQSLAWPSATNWFWLALLALFPGLVGHSLMNWSLTRIPVWLASTLTLAIPVTSTLLAWLFIDEPVRMVQFAGMGVVVVALGLIVLRSAAPEASAAGHAVEAEVHGGGEIAEVAAVAPGAPSRPGSAPAAS
jgi:drug/metabolite transporter (DMT)-like permease